MITCEYCNSKIEGFRFCTPKHKMAFVRTHPDIYKKVLPTSNTATPLPKSNTKLPTSNKTSQLPKSNNVVTKSNLRKVMKESNSSICEHGSMKGLCRKGCK